MANLGRGDNVDETSLAAATAAIITARWGGPPRRAQTPEPALVGSAASAPGNGYGQADNGNGGSTYGGAANGEGGYGSSDETPLTYRRDELPARYGPPAEPPTYGRSDELGPTYGRSDELGPTYGRSDETGPTYGRSDGLPSRLGADGAGSHGGATYGGAPAGGTYGGPNGGANGARATATVDRPLPPPLAERDAEPQFEPPPARESFRGAASPPPMFTPATFTPMPDVFAPPAMVPGGDSEIRRPVQYAPPEVYAPSDPDAFDAFAAPAPDAYAPHPYPPVDGGRSTPAPPFAPGLPTPAVPTPAMPAPVSPAPSNPGASIPAQRAPESSDPLAPGFAASVPVDDFAGSVMSGLAFPEPFVPEPYDPAAFSLAGYGSDGASVNGYDGASFGYTENGNGPNGHNGNGRAAPGPNGNGHPTNGFTAVREPVRETPHDTAPARSPAPASLREERGRRGAPADPLDIDTEAMLPRRVPSVPDVPDVFLPNDPAADGFELTRIASYLREEKVDETDNRPDGFDVAAVLAAVRGVTGVRDAQLRWNTGYGHTLRVEFDPGADEGEVTRSVAGMLRESMGLAAQPGLLGGPAPSGMPPRFNGENTLERNRRAAVAAPVANPAGRASRAAVPTNRPMPVPDGLGAVRVVLDHVQVTTLGAEATVEVRLAVAGGAGAGTGAKGTGQGPAVDAYLLRLAASAAGDAVDQLLVDPASRAQRGRVFIEHVSVVPFGSVEVAVVVALLMCGPEAEQVSGSAIVTGDPRHAVVRATLSAVNRRLESLLA